MIYHRNFTVVLMKEAKYLSVSMLLSEEEKQKINQESNMFKKWQTTYFLVEVKLEIHIPIS